jgi:hypothetical protein
MLSSPGKLGSIFSREYSRIQSLFFVGAYPKRMLNEVKCGNRFPPQKPSKKWEGILFFLSPVLGLSFVNYNL